MAIQGEHPIARWLDTTLPQLVNQHITNRENRIHEKQMLEERQNFQKEMEENSKNARREEILLRNQLDQLNSDRDYYRKKIDSNSALLKEFSTTAANFSFVPDENSTDAGQTVLKEFGEGITRPLMKDIEAYSNLEGAIANTSSNLDYLSETIAIQDQLLAGANRGTQAAMLVEDMNDDRQLTVDDFNLYLQQKEEAGEGLTDIEKIGFEKTFPKAVDAFNKSLLALTKVDESRAKANKTLSENATALAMENGSMWNPLKFTSTMNVHTDRLAGIYETAEEKGGLPDKFKKEGLTYDMTKISLKDKDVTPEAVYNSMDMIATNIRDMVRYGGGQDLFMLEKDGTIINAYDNLEAALSNSNPKAVRDAMKDFIQASNKYSNNFKDPLDFKGGLFPGNVSDTGVEHQFFNDMLNYYKQLDLGMIPLENPELGNTSGFFSSEEEIVAQNEAEALNEELAKGYTVKATGDLTGIGTDAELGLYNDKQLGELVPYGQEAFDPASLFTMNLDEVPEGYSPDYIESTAITPAGEKRFTRVGMDWIEDPQGTHIQDASYAGGMRKVDKSDLMDIDRSGLYSINLPDDIVDVAGN